MSFSRMSFSRADLCTSGALLPPAIASLRPFRSIGCKLGPVGKSWPRGTGSVGDSVGYRARHNTHAGATAGATRTPCNARVLCDISRRSSSTSRRTWRARLWCCSASTPTATPSARYVSTPTATPWARLPLCLQPSACAAWPLYLFCARVCFGGVGRQRVERQGAHL
jgi:hypothetical protein